MGYDPGEIREDMSVSTDRYAAARRRGRNGIGSDGNTNAAIQKALCCCKEKACKLLRELEDAGLIERKRQGQGFPARIYVKRFQRSEIPTSRGRENRLESY